MSEPHSIPSKINVDTNAVTTSDSARKLYITSILYSGQMEIDGTTIYNPGPTNLSSPILCDTFTAAGAGQIAYYVR